MGQSKKVCLKKFNIQTNQIYEIWRRIRRPISFEFVLKKTYTYSVNGKKHESNQTPYIKRNLSLCLIFSKKYENYRKYPNYLDAEKNIKDWIGRPITVYFNPGNPRVACLENRFEKEIFLPIFMGLIFGTELTYFAYYILNPLFQ